ncbi:MAG: acyltransferase family protein [Terracidiphilus sp.]|jgi:peptidoglycan/LPS O-acetylase OafA/YrhL
MDTPHRGISYRPDIDGLRAVAVTSVVAYHCAESLVPGGFIGVDVFFVISGYLIGAMVYKEIRDRSFSIARFYERRAKRILPALIGVLLCTYMAGLLLLSPRELQALSRSALYTIASSSNFFFMQSAANYYAADSSQSPLLMTWSLGVEEQFYILFPLLMLLMRGRRWQAQFLAISGLSAVSLAVCLEGNNWYPGFAFYMLPARTWELAGGVLLAMFEANRGSEKSAAPRWAVHGLSLLGCASILAALFPIGPQKAYPGYATLLPTGGAILVIAAKNGIANRALAWRPFVFIGLISYSWYLWHWPMLSFANITSDSQISLHAGVAIGILSFGFAVLSYFFVERLFRNSPTPTKRLLWRYAALAAAIALPAMVFLFTNGLPQRNREAALLDTLDYPSARGVCQAPPWARHPSLSPPCVAVGNRRAVALIGDSHAARLASTLRAKSESEGYRFVQITKSWCPPLAGGISRAINIAPASARNCAEFNREGLSFILADPSIRFVILAAHWDDPFQRTNEPYVNENQDPSSVTPEQNRAAFERGLREIVERLNLAGRQVYIVQDNPELFFEPARQMMTRAIAARRIAAGLIARSTMRRLASDFASSFDGPAQQYSRRFISDLATEYPNVQLIDLRSDLCSGNECRFAEKDRSLYWDHEHLTELGAQIALSGFQISH